MKNWAIGLFVLCPAMVLCPATGWAQAGELKSDATAQEQEQADLQGCLGHGEYCGPLVVVGRDLDRVRTDKTAQEIMLSLAGAQSVEQALAGVAGLQQFRRSDARSANPTSQGITMRGLGGNASSRVLLVMDGVPQADPFGGWVSWPGYDAAPVSEAQVQRGGGSVAYGPGAVAGTIELLSKRPTNDSDVMPLSLMLGSRRSLNISSKFHRTSGNTVVMVGAGADRGDGFVPIIASQRGPVDRAAPYANYGAAVRVLSTIAPATEAQINVRGFADRRSRGVPFSANANSGVDASIRLVSRDLPWGYSFTFYMQQRRLSSQFAAVSADRKTAIQTLDQYAVPSTGFGARVEVDPTPGSGWGRVRLGVDARAVDGETREFFQYLAAVPQRQRIAGGSGRTVGGFADIELGDDNNILVSLNGRVDQWRIARGYRREVDIAGAAIGTVRAADRYVARSGWEWTGRAGVMVPVSETLDLKASAYRAWRLPTLNELYRPFRVGADAVAANPALLPERVVGVEAGFAWHPDVAKIQGTVFYNRLHNAVANITLARGPGVFAGVGFVASGGSYSQRQNLDAIISKGFEVDAIVHPVRNITATASVAYTDAAVRGAGVSVVLTGKRPAQVAKWSGTLNIEYHAPVPDAVRAYVSLRYVGAQNEDDLGLQRLKPAFTVDSGIERSIGYGLSANVRVENLFDAQVQAGISRTGIIERAAPRTIWIGVRADIQ